MTTYQRKPAPVQAWQFQAQPYAEWPEFVKSFQVHTNMGARSPSMTIVQTLAIPVRHGPDITVDKGDWVVLENGILLKVRGTDFDAQFEAVEA
jgi:hypothetical protein